MEVKQFTQGAFTDAFDGSAADLLSRIIPAAPAAPAAPVATLPPATAAAPTVPPVDDPLKAKPTLDEGRDANDLLNADEADKKEKEAAALAAQTPEEQATAAAKAKKGRPVEKLGEPVVTLFSNLIKEKVLFGFEDGKIETVKDVQDLLDANLNHRMEAQQKEIYDGVFRSMTPAMQTVLQFAGQVTSPSELLPLLQTSSNAERFASLDPENVAHQELIVRERMRMNGDPDAVIEQEITDLKDRNKMAEKAKAYKPVLQQFYERQAQQILAEKQREEEQYFQQIQLNDQHLRKVLDAPELEGIKLKNNHKGIVYELLAIPREEYGGGVGIYSVIDRLFQEGKFDKLAKIALLVGDEKAFEEAYSTKLRLQNADNTIRKLNTGNRSAGPTVTDDDIPPEPQPTVRRPARAGFGFSNQ